MKKLALILFTLIPLLAVGEYRAYQYTVQNKINNANDAPNARFVVSTLNPVSYVAYHGGGRLIQVELLRTWICPGHTGHRKKICPSPYEQIIERTFR